MKIIILIISIFILSCSRSPKLQNGLVEIPQTENPLYVEKEGYVPTTFINFNEDTFTYKLKPHLISTRLVKIEGNTSGYGTLKRDKNFDFSMVLPAFERVNLIDFDVSQVLSPEFDRIKVPTRHVTMPSNVGLPKQSEKYLFFTIRFDKPQYKLFVPEPGEYSLFASHGQFPMKPIMNGLQKGHSMYALLNYFNFKQGGIRQVVAPSDITGQDITVNEIAYDRSVNIQGPTLKSNEVMMTTTMVERNGYLYPTDIKNFKSNESHKFKVNGESFENGYIMSILKNDDLKTSNPQFKEMSMHIQSMENINQSADFIEFIAEPQMNENSIRIQLPQLPNQLKEHSTVLSLIEIEKIKVEDAESEKKTILYEVVSAGWSPQMDTSGFKLNKKPGRFYRWKASVIAAPVGENNLPTHVSTNAVDF